MMNYPGWFVKLANDIQTHDAQVLQKKQAAKNCFPIPNYFRQYGVTDSTFNVINIVIIGAFVGDIAAAFIAGHGGPEWAAKHPYVVDVFAACSIGGLVLFGKFLGAFNF